MNVAIIGHGPSLEGEGLGKQIDQADRNIRLKMGWQLIRTNPADYGSRLDILMCSTETLGTILIRAQELVEYVNEFVAYPKRGFYDQKTVRHFEDEMDRDLSIPLNLFNQWNHHFRELGATHPNVSLGTAAIIYALGRFDPAEILLYGFDVLDDPDKEYDRIKTIPRTGVGSFPNHDWKNENILLRHLRRHYPGSSIVHVR